MPAQVTGVVVGETPLSFREGRQPSLLDEMMEKFGVMENLDRFEMRPVLRTKRRLQVEERRVLVFKSVVAMGAGRQDFMDLVLGEYLQV